METLIFLGLVFIPIKYIFDAYMAHRRRIRIWRHIPMSMRLHYDQRNVK